MADVQSQPGKICSLCGIDCTALPRTKDAKGRYICGECIERAKQAKASQSAPTPVPGASRATGPAAAEGAEDNSFLLDISGSSIKPKVDETAKPCPSCMKPLSEKTIVCLNCGYNSKTGEQLKVRVLKAKEEKSSNPARAKGYSVIHDVPDWAWLVGLFLVGFAPLLAGLFMGNQALFYLGSLFTGITMLVVHIMMIVAAFRQSSLAGILFLIGPFFLIGAIYCVYWMLFECEAEITKKLWLMSVGLYLITAVIVAVQPELMQAIEAGQ